MGKQSREKKERERQPQEGPLGKKSLLEKICFYIIEYGIYVALFSPLIVSANFFFPYVSPKTLFFRSIVDIIFIAYVILAFLNPCYRPRKNPLLITISVFIGVIILTSITGVNFEKSFWSVFERMGGLLTFLHLFAFFIILSSVFQERKYWERILTVSILAGVILSFYVFNSSEPTARGGGTLGNTSFMSAYLIFDIFFALILFLTKNWRWKIFYGATLIPLIWLLLFPPQEPTRGAIGAFFGGIFILFFGCLLFYLLSSGKKLLKGLSFVLLFLAILAVFAVTQTDLFKNKLVEFQQSSSWQSRAITWKMGYEAWREKPWLGWGLENFNIPFAKYYNPTLPISGDIWYDRTHNIVFDMLSGTGILGLLSYLSIFGVSILGLLKICPKLTKKRNAFFPIGLIALLVTYFAQNIWVFDMISSYMAFFLTLAFISFLIGKKEVSQNQIQETSNKMIHSFTAGFLIVISFMTLYFGNLQPARAANYIVNGMVLPLEKGIPLLQKAIEVSPMAIFETPENISRVVTNLVGDEKVDKKILEEGFNAGAEALKKNISKNPLDFRPVLILGRHYNDFFQITQDPAKLALAEGYLNKAIELSPKNQQSYWSLAQTRLSQGNIEGAIKLMQKAVDLEPRFGQSQWYLAMIYKINGNYKLALEAIENAEKIGGFNWRGNSANFKQVIEIYQQLQDDEKLSELYPEIIKIAPKDAQLYAGYAINLANMGQYQKAREMAEKAIELRPEYAKELEVFLNALPK